MATIIFDFDGTLHDSMYVYRIALNRGYQWLVEQGVAKPRVFSESDMEANIGLTAKEAWAHMAPDLPWSITGQAAARVGAVMDELIDNGTARLFPGVPEMLQQVKDAGHTLVFLSNCRNAYRDAVRRAFGFDAWFAGYYTSEQFGGIPKEEIPKVTERDYRASNSVYGTGIGLSLVDEIMKAHGGSVRIESELGHGTTVILTLPLHGSIKPETENIQQ